jgi:tRNA pseudouridine32 synthase/23S rRNA pseudouridine746 synthase
MKEIPGSPNSETHIAVVDNVGSLNLYQLRAITGRKHQLRLHMAALEIPVINDKLYPVLTTSDSDDFSRPLKLLARSISFQDPVTGRRHFFESSRSL